MNSSPAAHHGWAAQRQGKWHAASHHRRHLDLYIEDGPPQLRGCCQHGGEHGAACGLNHLCRSTAGALLVPSCALVGLNHHPGDWGVR